MNTYIIIACVILLILLTTKKVNDTEPFDKKITGVNEITCGKQCTKTLGCMSYAFDKHTGDCYLSNKNINTTPSEGKYANKYNPTNQHICTKLNTINETNVDTNEMNLLNKNKQYRCLSNPINTTYEDTAYKYVDGEWDKTTTYVANNHIIDPKYIGTCTARTSVNDCKEKCTDSPTCKAFHYMDKYKTKRKTYDDVCCPLDGYDESTQTEISKHGGEFYKIDDGNEVENVPNMIDAYYLYDGTLHDTRTVDNKTMCAKACNDTTNCEAIRYIPETQTCKLLKNLEKSPVQLTDKIMLKRT